ncbi:transposase domain-containing protein [Streptomyces sp. NPDC007901]|uniref:transposase domain-containing protein n=1 Tax=Streptomyces sp. NPDC007901 TaxID=3364785 RepID=UPI0036F01424
MAECGRSGQCNRQLRARVVVYLSLAYLPVRRAGIREGGAAAHAGLAWAKRCSWQVTDTAAISRARDRLGRDR